VARSVVGPHGIGTAGFRWARADSPVRRNPQVTTSSRPGPRGVMQRDGGFESDLSLPRAGDPRQRGGLGSAARAGVEAPSSYPTCILQDMSESSAHRHHAIDYVEFTVTDLEQAKRFYTQAFGWRFVGRPVGAAVFDRPGPVSGGGGARRRPSGERAVRVPRWSPVPLHRPSGNELGVWAEA